MKLIFYLIIVLLLIWSIIMLYGFFFSSRKDISPINELSQDRLVLFYNKDFLTIPPLTWQELKDLIPEFGLPLGRAENVEYSAEILSLLADQDNLVNALKFYTEFADESKKVYNWNSRRKNSLEEFLSGQVAMVFAKKSDSHKFSSLNYGLSPFPKIELSQNSPEFPVLDSNIRNIYKDLIEQVALKKMAAERAVESYGLK